MPELVALGDPRHGSVSGASVASASSLFRRYERSHPGELIHMAVKKLRRIEGGIRLRITRTPAPLECNAPIAPSLAASRWLGVRPRLLSTTPPRSPTSRCSPTRRPPPQLSSCVEPWLFYSPPRRSPSSAVYDRQPLRLPLDGARDHLPRTGDKALAHPSLPTRRPMARPSASSARCSAAAPMAPSTAALRSAARRLSVRSGATTSDDHTAPSAARPPAARLAEPRAPHGAGPGAARRARTDAPRQP